MKAAFVVFDRMTFHRVLRSSDPSKSMKIMDDFEWRICSMTQHAVDDRALRLEAEAID